MKYLFVITFSLALATQASAADTPSTSPDPFMALDDNLPAPTPVFKNQAAAAPSTPPAAMDNPAPTIGATENPVADGAAKTEMPVPIDSIPGKTEASPPPAAVNADSGKDVYDEYNDYLERTRQREKSEKDYSQRSLFPHENGSWQIGLAYARRAFSGYNFNRSNVGPKGNPDTDGALISLTYFPLKSLTWGRFGLGVIGGAYLSKFTTPTTDFVTGKAVSVSATPLQITSYGGRAIYEFDYVLGQLLVPFAFVGIDQVQIKRYSVETAMRTGTTTSFDTGPARSVSSTNYGGGARFNLNRVEPIVASRALVNTGIRKFYLTYTALDRAGELRGLTHNLGIDLEF